MVVSPDGAAGAPTAADVASADTLVAVGDAPRASGSTDADIIDFAGTYRYVTGTRLLTCPALGGSAIDQLSETVLIGQGISAPLVMVLPSGCTLNLDAMGNSAILRPGQVCPPQVISVGGEAATETDTYNGGAIVVNGNSATIAASGSVQLAAPNGVNVVCTFTVNGTLIKVTK